MLFLTARLQGVSLDMAAKMFQLWDNLLPDARKGRSGKFSSGDPGEHVLQITQAGLDFGVFPQGAIPAATAAGCDLEARVTTAASLVCEYLERMARTVNKCVRPDCSHLERRCSHAANCSVRAARNPKGRACFWWLWRQRSSHCESLFASTSWVARRSSFKFAALRTRGCASACAA